MTEKIKIEITRFLTRNERIAILQERIEEAEKHGFADIKIKVHNHQIVSISIEKGNQFGNCDPEWYKVLHDPEKYATL